MGLFSKKSETDEPKYTTTMQAESPECPHGVLTPRWDSVEDMGKDERATAYICEACHQSFTPEEAQALKASMTERLPVGETGLVEL
jgi:hypothetical protein